MRCIGHLEGKEHGPLIIAIGGMHGNEPAGVRAIERVITLLQAQQNLHFKGAFIGLIGNVQAYQKGQRYLHKDLNRAWHKSHLDWVMSMPLEQLSGEDREIGELAAYIHTSIETYRPETLVLLDLHTTSAAGGVFSIPTDEGYSTELAKALRAPVIIGLLDEIEGTLLQCGIDGHFKIGDIPPHNYGVAFEAGQHDDPRSEARCAAALLNCLAIAGCIPESLARSYPIPAIEKHLPSVTQLRHIHRIQEGDHFRMKPGYVNFQPIHRGEHLADDRHGPIYAPMDGFILMPLYQAQGSDGFFVVQDTVL